MHQTLVGSAAVTPGSGQRTIDGTLTVEHLLAKYTAVITATNLVRSETCCKPISGSVTIARAAFADGGASSTETLSFGPMCGQIDFEGTPLQIAECL